MTINDPIDEATSRALAQYALGVEALVEQAVALGMPQDLARALIETRRPAFLAELAEMVMSLREAIADDPMAARH